MERNRLYPDQWGAYPDTAASRSGDGLKVPLPFPSIEIWPSPVPSRSGIFQAQSNEEMIRLRQFRLTHHRSKPGVGGRADRAHDLRFDELDATGHVFYLERKGSVRATIRLNLPVEHPLPDSIARMFSIESFPGLPFESISFSSGLVIGDDWRSIRLALPLLQHTFRWLCLHRTEVDLYLCPVRYLAFFKRLGYRRYVRTLRPSSAGEFVPVALFLNDVTHLARVRSPFYGMAFHRTTNR